MSSVGVGLFKLRKETTK